MSGPAIKHDQNKAPLELLSRTALEQMAMVLALGRNKYGAHNWRGGMEWTRMHGAALRHITAHLDGEDKDSESGLSHIAHAACCLMFLLEYETKRMGKDDRFK